MVLRNVFPPLGFTLGQETYAYSLSFDDFDAETRLDWKTTEDIRQRDYRSASFSGSLPLLVMA